MSDWVMFRLDLRLWICRRLGIHLWQPFDDRNRECAHCWRREFLLWGGHWVEARGREELKRLKALRAASEGPEHWSQR